VQIRKQAILTALIVASFLSPGREIFAAPRGFTVRDSIEMTTFSDPSQVYGSSEAKASPDGSHYVVVTTRGLLESNEVQSTVWVFDTAEVLLRLSSAGERHSISPRAIATLTARPVKIAVVPYQALISDLRWATNSKSLYFLGQNSRGNRRLYQAFMDGTKATPISGDAYDVWRYDFAAGSLVYMATRAQHEQTFLAPPGAAINAAASSITELSIEQILFPNNITQPSPPELWVVLKGVPRKIKTKIVFPPAVEGQWDLLSISPDGTTVALLISCQTINFLWKSYLPATDFENRRIGSDDVRSLSPGNALRLKQYAVINLADGAARFVLDAPYGISLAYQDKVTALWSKDSKRVLLTNTFLPPDLESATEGILRDRPCAAASLDLTRNEVRCIVSTRDDVKETPRNPAPLRLQDVSFGGTPDEVVLKFAWPQKRGVIETFHSTVRGWQMIDSQEVARHAGVSSADKAGEENRHFLHVEIRQDLNTPPSLWAMDGSTGHAKKIWDPNPQLAQLRFGQVSVYRWKDATGYEWTGGLVLPLDYVPGRRYPLVIQTHGFRRDQFMTDGEYPTAMAAQPLASAGIAVLQVGGRSDHVLQPQEALDQLEGYSAAISQLSSQGIVDPHKVGLIGFSRTCWYVELALIKYPNLYAAATLADGIDESYMQYMLFPEYHASESETIHGGRPFGEQLSGWLTSSPDAQLDKVQAAIRIEAITPKSVLGRWELFSALKLQGKVVDFVYIPNGQHILQSPLDRMASQQGNVDWFKFWLLGKESPYLVHNAQYQKWKAFRANDSSSLRQ
jgi:dipeptidyl aminopeptidase/acylaminoacyl peptidase